MTLFTMRVVMMMVGLVVVAMTLFTMRVVGVTVGMVVVMVVGVTVGVVMVMVVEVMMGMLIIGLIASVAVSKRRFLKKLRTPQSADEQVQSNGDHH
jgi:predicted lipid-binding transport protein (Tim44 family)